MIDIKVRRVDGFHAEVKVETLEGIHDLGLFDRDELRELAIILSEQLTDLLMDLDRLDE